MKNNTNSFLFFVVTVCFFFLGNEKIVGQNIIDSIPYYVDKVQNFKTADELIKAKTYLEKKESTLKRNDVSRLYLIYSISSAEKAMGNFIKAENLLVNVLDNIQQFKSSDYRDFYHISYYLLLGNIYREHKNGEKALELYNRAFEKVKTPQDSGVIYNNISNIYKDVLDYEKSEEILLKALSVTSRMTEQKDIARVYDNLGFAMSKLEKKTGLEFMKKGLELRFKIKDNKGLLSSYKQLAIHYKDNENDSLAKVYAIKAFHISNKLNIPKYREDALGALIQLGQYSYAREYKRLSDSLENVRSLQENKFAIYRYDKSKSEKRAIESEFKMLLFAFLGGLIFVVAIFLIILQRNRNKRHTIEQVHKTERDFSKKVHDELGNDIFYLMNQIQTNPASLFEKEGLKVLNGLNDIYVKARDISKKYTSIDTGIAYHDEVLALLNSFGNDTIKIVTNEITPDFWEAVVPLKKEQLYRVLQELLTNMKKHSEASLVAVTFTKYKRYIVIKYVDNGKGAEATLLSKNGLHNVENRMDEIKGTITFDTNPNEGFKAEIRFIA